MFISRMTPSTVDDEYANKFLRAVQVVAGWLGSKQPKGQ